MKEDRKRLQEEVRHSVAAKEKDISSHLDLRAKELSSRERKIVEDERQLEKRKNRLVEAEREIKQRQQSLLDERRRVGEEAELRVQRVKEDMAHKLDLSKQSLLQVQQSAQKAEERLQSAQEEYRKLYEEHNAFRLRLATSPDSQHIQYIETLRSQHAAELSALSERSDRRLSEASSQLQSRLRAAEDDARRLSNALTQKKEQLREAELRAASSQSKVESLQREVNSLLRQVQQPSPIPIVPYPGGDKGGGGGMNGRAHSGGGGSGLNTSGTQPVAEIPDISALREAVSRSTTLELSRLQQQQQQHHQAASSSSPQHRDVALAKEVERLQKERDALLYGSGGAYTLADPIVKDITNRIVQLQRSLAMSPQR